MGLNKAQFFPGIDRTRRETFTPWFMKMNQRISRLALVAGLVTLVSRAEETAVIKEQTINVRGQPSLIGEVITQLKRGEKVVILEEISISKPKKDEPAQW